METKSKQIKNMKLQVQDILTRYPEARDSDRELIALYWEIQQPLLFAFRTAEAVIRAFKACELTMPDDITRTRRMVQMQYPDLRSTKQKERDAMEADVTANINREP